MPSVETAVQTNRLVHTMQEYEVVIVGGGPAGLSAALVLGRCLRTVLVCDSGQPRNQSSRAMHGFLTRDNIPPLEFLDIARTQLQRYENVTFLNNEVTDIIRNQEGFKVTLADHTNITCRKLLLATGVVDNLPPIQGIEQLYGKNAFHCPYCDGWEVRRLPIVVYGRGKRGHGLSLDLKNWTDQVTLCTDGPSELSGEEINKLTESSIQIIEDRIQSVQPAATNFINLQFINGNSLEFGAMFFTLGHKQRCQFPKLLGCEFTDKGAVDTNNYQATGVPNLYVAGDASHDLQLVIVAAAEGAKAAFAINKSLIEKEIKSED